MMKEQVQLNPHIQSNLEKKIEERLTSKSVQFMATLESDIKHIITDVKWEKGFTKGPFEGYSSIMGGKVVSKSIGIFTCTPIELVALLNKPDSMKKIDKLLDKIILIERLEGGITILKMQYKGKFPVKQRDFMIASYWKKEGDTYFNYGKSIEDAPHDPAYVRATMYFAYV